MAIANVLEIPQSCTKSSICVVRFNVSNVNDTILTNMSKFITLINMSVYNPAKTKGQNHAQESLHLKILEIEFVQFVYMVM